MAKQAKRQPIIQSLDKGLHVLEMIEEARVPLTLQDIWSRLRWNKATIHRILNTLQVRGYLSRNRQTKAYSLGIRVLALYNSLSMSFNIQQMIRPYLDSIVAETGETAHIAIVLNNKVVFIDRVRGRKIISANTEVGQTLPLHCTALGKSYLAFIDEEEIPGMLKMPLARFTEKTITGVEALKAELERVRRQGYAVDLGEYVAELRCVAAPILDHMRLPIAMIGISGPRSELNLKQCNEYGKLIRRMAERVSSEVGYPTQAHR